MASSRLTPSLTVSLKEEKSYKEGTLDGTSKVTLLPEKWKVKETSGWGKSTGSNCRTNLTVLCGKSIITRTEAGRQTVYFF